MRKDDFPELTQLLEKCLYQLSAPTFEEAVEQYRLNGPNAVSAVIAEIDWVLGSGLTHTEVTTFVEQHSDYLVDTDGKATLAAIRAILIGAPPGSP